MDETKSGDMPPKEEVVAAAAAEEPPKKQHKSNNEQTPKPETNTQQKSSTSTSTSAASPTRAADCPIARNAELLRELDSAELKVAQLLDVAAEALDQLSEGVDSLDRSTIDESNKAFLGLVSQVHGCLAPKADWIRDYKPYPRSIYGPRKELELLHEKAEFLKFELASMSKGTAALPEEIDGSGSDVAGENSKSSEVENGSAGANDGEAGGKGVKGAEAAAAAAAGLQISLEQGTVAVGDATPGDSAATPMDVG